MLLTYVLKASIEVFMRIDSSAPANKQKEKIVIKQFYFYNQSQIKRTSSNVTNFQLIDLKTFTPSWGSTRNLVLVVLIIL